MTASSIMQYCIRLRGVLVTEIRYRRAWRTDRQWATMSQHAQLAVLTQKSKFKKKQEQISKVIWQKKPHRRRTPTVVNASTFPLIRIWSQTIASPHKKCSHPWESVSPSNTRSLGHTRVCPLSKWYFDRFIRFCTAHLYFTFTHRSCCMPQVPEKAASTHCLRAMLPKN